MKMKSVHYSKQEYAEYLSSEEWLKLRSFVLNDGTKCQRCKTATASQVHHTKYRAIVNVRITDLIPLCDPCHGKISVAIKVGLFPKTHTPAMVESYTDERMGNQISHNLTRVELKSDVLEKINRLSVQGQRLVAGLVKRPCPADFRSWDGLKVTGKAYDRIRWTIKKFCQGGKYR